MSEDRFIFETVDFQNGANTINNFVKVYNAQCNAAATGNTFKFKSDYDRMKNLLGSSGQSRNSGYYEGLYASLYALTITNPTLPSSNGPGNSGWGRKLWSGPIDPILINDAYMQAKGGQANYVGVEIGGYLYSPVATNTILETLSDDGVLVFFNGTRVINNWTYHGPTTDTSATLTVNAGYNPITIRFFEGDVTGVLNFVYKLPATGAFTGLLNCNFFYNYNQM
jgi:hypothetical protein